MLVVIPLKSKKGIAIVNAFKVILDSSKRKPNKYELTKVVKFITVLLKNGYKRLT